MTAHRDKEIGGYYYRGYYFCKPEGSSNWNIYSVSNNIPNFGMVICHCKNFKECKATIDMIQKGEILS